MINLLGTKDSYNTPVTLVSEYYAFSPYLIHRKKRKRKEREGIEEREIKEENRKKLQKRIRKKILLSYKSTEICQKVRNKNK